MSVQAHVGTWTDWSIDSVFLRWMLTLPSKYGVFLTPFLVLLVNTAGSAVWSIAAFNIHQHRVSLVEMDDYDFQIQLLLRNSTNQWLFVGQLLYLAWTHRHTVRKAWKRAAVVAAWPLLIGIIFFLLSLWVSQVTSTAEKLNNVLIRPETCGVVDASSAALIDAANFAAKNANDARIAAARVTSCASGSPYDCLGLPVSQLSYALAEVPCPFLGQGRCITPALQLLTDWINSNFDLGINTELHQQVDMRFSTTCSVLSVKDFVKSIPDTSVVDNATQILVIDIGPTTAFNFTNVYATRLVNATLPYTISTVYNLAGNATASVWQPNSDFNVTNADVVAHFLAANSITYTHPVFDAAFSANGTYNTTLTDGTVLYLPDHYLTVLGCTEQFEYRNPVNNATTGLLGYLQARAASFEIGLGEEQIATAFRMHLAAWSARNSNTVSSQGVNALEATKALHGLMSSRLPANQSQLEFLHWSETGLANFQARIADFATNTWASSETEQSIGLKVKPASSYSGALGAALQQQCNWQRVKSAGQYVNYYFSAVLVVLISTVVLLLSSWALPWVVSKFPNRQAARAADERGFFRRHRPAREEGSLRYRLLAWDADHLLSSGTAARPHRDEPEVREMLIRDPVERHSEDSESNIDHAHQPEIMPEAAQNVDNH